MARSRTVQGPRPFVGLAAGIAAGLVAAAAMAAFEAQASKLIEDEGGDAPDEPEGGAAPYIVGAVIGGIYGVISEYRPEASGGFTGTYGIAAAALADPAGSLGLDSGADEAPDAIRTASNLVFGAVLEGVRWLIGGRR
ncbi:DUF1440 domain-containing protein [Sphingomonas sp. LB-2]|uniref:DUF1440 domain-containing protein n=1 Tax=Sphingomonas caeni TaxID=2984949 RepID=UPI00222E92B8|nr:DUF1440 domain-containing protein [Sphingomonas caeni]MCW3847885.1 DUF1440 domain-containing protein [Sphingomonas caeni]